MMKINRKTVIITSIVLLLPMVMGIIMWNELPATMNIHWGFEGAADGTGSKAFAVFGMPLILLPFHFLCIFVTAKDRKNGNQTGKALSLALWAVPCVSVFTSSIIYASAMGREVRSEVITPIFLGLLFVIVGNYLPKCRQNYTVGIKLPWTYTSEENWNMTHRLGGKLWVAGGIAILASSFFPAGVMEWFMLTAVAVMVIVPTVYSYVFYRKQLAKDETVSVKNLVRTKPEMVKSSKVILAITVIIIVGVIVICFTGNIDIVYGENSFEINADFWEDMEITYDAIENITYRSDFKVGIRTFGFGTPRLALGTFKNDELGSYTRYGYTGCHSCVILEADGKYLVISGKDEAATKAVYDTLTEKCEVKHE